MTRKKYPKIHEENCTCHKCSRVRRNAATQARESKRQEKIAANKVLRPNCPNPQWTALTSYLNGCRCGNCVEARRSVARISQYERYAVMREKARLIAKEERRARGNAQ